MEAVTLFFEVTAMSIIAIVLIIAVRAFLVHRFITNIITKATWFIIEDYESQNATDDKNIERHRNTSRRIQLMKRLDFVEVFFSTKPLKASSWYTDEEMEFMGLNN